MRFLASFEVVLMEGESVAVKRWEGTGALSAPAGLPDSPEHAVVPRERWTHDGVKPIARYIGISSFDFRDEELKAGVFFGHRYPRLRALLKRETDVVMDVQISLVCRDRLNRRPGH